MISRLFPLCLTAVVLLGMRVPAAEPTTYPFGKDEIVLPPASASADAEKGRPYDRDPRKSRGVRKLKHDGLPIPNGISLFRLLGGDVVAEVGQRRVYVTHRNIGQYLGELRDPKQITAVLSLFHRHLERNRLDAAGFSRVVKHAEQKPEALPFVVHHKEVELATVDKGVFRLDGVWLAHFMCVEAGSSVVEYKYAILPGREIARIRRVLVEGPKNPCEQGEFLPPSLWAPERQEAWKRYKRCCDYLDSTMNARRVSELGEYWFGDDFIMLSHAPQMKANRDGRPFAGGVQRRKGVDKLEPNALPFRKDVSLYRLPYGDVVADVAVRQVYVTASNVGQFVEDIRDVKQVAAMLSILHEDYDQSLISAEAFQRLVKLAASEPDVWTFSTRAGYKDVDAGTVNKGIFERDGCWLAHFLYVTRNNSVVECKYVIWQGKEIGSIQRLLVEGEVNPCENGETEPADDWSPKKLERWKKYKRCRDAIESLIKPERKEDEADGNPHPPPSPR
jgi:hypothetical protein